jgi:hypothetical protein
MDTIPGVGESNAAIEYDPVAPTKRRRRLPLLLLVVAAALLLGGIGGWVLRGWVAALSPEAVVIGQASEFPPGSVIEVALDVGHFDPVGFESPEAEPSGGREFGSTRLFVVNDSEVGLSAVSLRSPWMGCRVGVVTRAMAIEFGHQVPTGFEKGFLDPCHGGLFSLDGQHLAGPGHRGLNSFPVGYLPDGSVVVDLTGLKLSAPSRREAGPIATDRDQGDVFGGKLIGP